MRRILFASMLGMVISSGAQAEFYPYYSGAAHMRQQAVSSYVPHAQPLPTNVVPQRYYAPAYGATPAYAAPAPVTPAPAVIAAPMPYTPPPAVAPTQMASAAPATYIAPPPSYVAPVAAPTPAPQYVAAAAPYTPPAYVAPTPAPAVIAYQPPAYNYNSQAYVAPVAAAPVATAAEPAAFNRYYDPQRQGLRRPNQYYIGIDSFYDRYEERDVDLDNRGLFGSLEYGFNHYFTPTWFVDFDGRSSYGRTSYESISGKISQIVDYEFDHSLKLGYDFNYGGGRHFKPYLGLGVRYFNEQGKGERTNLNFVGYDRRFTQFYMPAGLAFEAPFGANYVFAPLVEVSPLLYGYGESRFQSFGLEKLSHIQHEGYRLRMEAMFRKTDERGYGFEFGPFLNYWDVDDSELDTNSGVFPDYYVEPENKRLQVGVSAKWLF